jgi:outer membrane protein, heavy metal efflux system
VQRRNERVGSSFNEREFAIERPLRWGNKAAMDGRLAEAGLATAVSGYEDAWHESGRALLKAWFDLAREERSIASLIAQAELSRQQVSVVERRVAAGDAPRLEALLAQGEHQRSLAALASTRLSTQALRVAFDRKYPALRGQSLPTLPFSPATLQTDASSLEAAILADNHEIELAHATTTLARLRQERTHSEKRGDPTLGLRYAQERGGQDTVIGVHIAIPFSLPFGTSARDTRSRLAQIEADKAEAREREVKVRVGVEAQQAAQAVAFSHQIALQLSAAAAQAHTAATLAGRAYAEGETLLTNWLQARRQASEAQLAASLAQVSALEAAARAQLDAHQLWVPLALEGIDNSAHEHADTAPH